jgi:IS30 family transposase
VAVGFVPALDRLMVREVSPRFLSQDERIEIADLYRVGRSIRQIATVLGRAPSTISRELRRNATSSDKYQPFEAHRQAAARRERRHPRRLTTNEQLGLIVAELLAQRCPQQISRNLRARFPADPGMWLCHESIYQALYQPGSDLMRPLPLAPHRRSPLRTGRDHRRAHSNAKQRRPRFQQPMLSVHQRPFDPKDRSEAGHGKAI